MTSTPGAILPSVPLCTTPVTVPAAAAVAKARRREEASAPRRERERKRRRSHPSRVLTRKSCLPGTSSRRATAACIGARRVGHPQTILVVILRSEATKNPSFFAEKDEE